jgi:hypothetical protein
MYLFYSSGTRKWLASIGWRRWRHLASVHTLNSTARNVVLDSLGAASVNLAADAERGAEDLLHSTLERFGERLVLHGTGDLDDLVEGYRLRVLDVLLLLAVSGRLLESLDDKSRCSRDNGDSGLTVLDGELHRDTKTLLLIVMIPSAIA